MDMKINDRTYIIPLCCTHEGFLLTQFIREPIIFVGYNYADWVNVCYGKDVKPHWILSRTVYVRFCPYCGIKLREIVERIGGPENICTITDGGYYCDTCKKRLNECQCEMPWMRWTTGPLPCD